MFGPSHTKHKNASHHSSLYSSVLLLELHGSDCDKPTKPRTSAVNSAKINTFFLHLDRRGAFYQLVLRFGGQLRSTHVHRAVLLYDVQHTVYFAILPVQDAEGLKAYNGN